MMFLNVQLDLSEIRDNLYNTNNIHNEQFKVVLMDSNKKTLEKKLNFINDAKKTNIAKIHIESVKMVE